MGASGYSLPTGVEAPPDDAFFLVRPDRLISNEYGCDVVAVDSYNARLHCWDAGAEEPDQVRAKLMPVDGGFDLQLDDYEPFCIIPCEKQTS